MKLNIQKIFGILGLATLLYSCDTTNESGYIPEVYTSPTTFTIVEDASATADNSFAITYTPSTSGSAYYAVLPTGSPAPTSTQVHSLSSSFQQAGTFDVDGTTPVDIIVDSNIFGSYTYDVYAIHKSTDNFISETVTKLTVTTPDTSDPSFLKEESDPAFTSADISPFAPVTFAFDEPVFYQGGDITFTAFDGGSGTGRTIIVNDPAALTASGTTITVNTHGTFQQGDFIIVSWDAGTFKDNAGKEVAELSGFEHYFSTREYTLPEIAFLMQGEWDYATQFYGGLTNFYSGNAALFLPDTGQFELTLDPSDPSGTTLLGINIFSPLKELGFPAAQDNLKIKLGPDGVILELDENQTAGIPLQSGAATEWQAWSIFGSTFPGFYDLDGGTINHWLTLIIADTGDAIDDIDYNYTRNGAFARSNTKTFNSLEKKNSLLKDKKVQNKTYTKNVKIGF